MKKILLSLGSAAAVVAPVTMAISCGDTEIEWQTVDLTNEANKKELAELLTDTSTTIGANFSEITSLKVMYNESESVVASNNNYQKTAEGIQIVGKDKSGTKLSWTYYSSQTMEAPQESILANDSESNKDVKYSGTTSYTINGKNKKEYSLQEFNKLNKDSEEAKQISTMVKVAYEIFEGFYNIR